MIRSIAAFFVLLFLSAPATSQPFFNGAFTGDSFFSEGKIFLTFTNAHDSVKGRYNEPGNGLADYIITGKIEYDVLNATMTRPGEPLFEYKLICIPDPPFFYMNVKNKKDKHVFGPVVFSPLKGTNNIPGTGFKNIDKRLTGSWIKTAYILIEESWYLWKEMLTIRKDSTLVLYEDFTAFVGTEKKDIPGTPFTEKETLQILVSSNYLIYAARPGTEKKPLYKYTFTASGDLFIASIRDGTTAVWKKQ